NDLQLTLRRYRRHFQRGRITAAEALVEILGIGKDPFQVKKILFEWLPQKCECRRPNARLSSLDRDAGKLQQVSPESVTDRLVRELVDLGLSIVLFEPVVD